MALALLVLGRAAHLPLRGIQGRRDARLLVLIFHDGPVEHIVPLEACTQRWQTCREVEAMLEESMAAGARFSTVTKDSACRQMAAFAIAGEAFAG